MEAIIMVSSKENTNSTIYQTVQNYGNKLLGFIRNKVGTREDAEDILQEVWYQLSNLSNLSDIENVSAWLYRVARNKITDRYRKTTTESIEDFILESEDGEFNLKELLLYDDSNNPNRTLFKNTIWKALFQALDELPENQKTVFIQNELEDLSLQEIADNTGENLKTIISRKGYAVKHLRKKLNYLYQELNDE